MGKFKKSVSLTKTFTFYKTILQHLHHKQLDLDSKYSYFSYFKFLKIMNKTTTKTENDKV